MPPYWSGTPAAVSAAFDCVAYRRPHLLRHYRSCVQAALKVSTVTTVEFTSLGSEESASDVDAKVRQFFRSRSGRVFMVHESNRWQRAIHWFTLWFELVGAIVIGMELVRQCLVVDTLRIFRADIRAAMMVTSDRVQYRRPKLDAHIICRTCRLR